MNILPYDKALKYDKRNFYEFYLSLLKIKQILIFTFYTSNDYNSRVMKISLFLFLISLSLAINALFFNDSNIHKIYEEEGNFNFLYQIPNIIYSSILSSVINGLIKYLSLSQNDIIKLKQEEQEENNHIEDKDIKLLKCLSIKFIIYFMLLILLLILFWFYLSCFCVVYKNTQIFLIKDTLISFGFSLLYSFGTNIIPCIFRILSLKTQKKDKVCLYKISKFLI